MLELQVKATEFYDEEAGEFVTISAQILRLEHSLYSVAKWESKWKKAFLGGRKSDKKTPEEMLDYVRCMSLDENVNPLVFLCLTQDDMNKIDEYINDSMTATTINNKNEKPSREIVTAEIMYYWLVAAQIPFECQYWHLNRLMTLVQVVNIKNQPPKKMSKKDLYNRHRSVNAARRKPRG